MLKHIDNLSADILDEDFVKMFRAIHFIQRIIGFLRVNITYRFATAPSVLCKMYGGFVLVIHAVFIVDTVIHSQTVFKTPTTNYFLKVGTLINGLLNGAVSWQNTFCNGNLNSQVYVKLQKIDRNLDMRSTFNVNSNIAFISNMVSIVTLSIATVMLSVILTNVLINHRFYPATLVSLVPLLGTFTDMILFFFLIYFINIRMEHINNILDGNKRREKSTIGKVFNIIWMVEDVNKTDAAVFNKLVPGVHCIMDVIADLMQVFQFPIFSYTCQLMVWDLILMQSVVTTVADKKSTDFYSGVYVLPVVSAQLIVLLSACIIAEAFTSKLEKTRKLCIKIISRPEAGISVQSAKKLLLLLDVKCDLTVYEIFKLNTQLPLDLFGITATYTIVLLQFALL